MVRAVLVGVVFSVVLVGAACSPAPVGAPAPSTTSSPPSPPVSTPIVVPPSTTPPAAAPVTVDPAGQVLDDYLAGMAVQQQFRGAVEVRRGADVLLRKGYGDADVGTSTPVTPDTRFQVGSLTKQFTAVAVLRLQDQGKVRVTDLVCSHLADCPPDWAPITVDQLLTHTSGIYNYTEAGEDEAKPFLNRHVVPQELVDYVKGKPLDFTPGSRWKYSNSGYVLLGVLVERLSGMDYATFLRQQLFDPLGMRDTGYDTLRSPRANGYTDWTTPGEDDVSLYFSAGGVLSTTGDLARWNAFLLSDKPGVISSTSRAAMLSPHADIPGTQVHYGYGIEVHGGGADLTYAHGGLVTGYRCENTIRPSDALSVTVLTNLATNDPESISGHLIELAGRP
ncbi:serine hydrolase domain-containing protein [Umezawaea sp. Da 62-37]|uniref:serine hydrolase domain-containing protein n=1 Tax=Umezawaea sp. Da 62-37 TaxID=3075927 RepID=UPI0028F70EED|nr:serine hydrolase domain-containing protein [Umezawaea sp. Da 62-37]WNV87246.1 serine hydrolase domain-containing protein [Umezawaea sp. Da 62-37]